MFSCDESMQQDDQIIRYAATERKFEACAGGCANALFFPDIVIGQGLSELQLQVAPMLSFSLIL